MTDLTKSYMCNHNCVILCIGKASSAIITHISAWVGVKVGSLKECVAIIVAVLVVIVVISVVEDAVVVVVVLVAIAAVMVDISLFLEG